MKRMFYISTSSNPVDNLSYDRIKTDFARHTIAANSVGFTWDLSAAENEQVTQTQRHLQTETTNEKPREPEHAFDTPKTRTINFYAVFLFGELKRKIILFGTDNKQKYLSFGIGIWRSILEFGIQHFKCDYELCCRVEPKKKLAAMTYEAKKLV